MLKTSSLAVTLLVALPIIGWPQSVEIKSTQTTYKRSKATEEQWKTFTVNRPTVSGLNAALN
ncbi:MAG: hypothetical protein ABUL72_04065, partial [Armatimonadota bacterium]